MGFIFQLGGKGETSPKVIEIIILKDPTLPFLFLLVILD